MKSRRQKKIIELINEYEIETQDELIAKLREAKFDVTQATVSRDIRELKIVKISTADKKFKYSMALRDDMVISERYLNILRETVISVNYAGNMVVLKTYAGMAQAAAAAIDGKSWDEIVGTLAGDDTIFVLMKDEGAAHKFTDKIKAINRAKN